jgi:hypothetical protein
MKVLKITVFALFLLNILVTAFQSCTKDSSKTNNATVATLENLVNTYNAGVVFEHEKAILMEGEMTAMTLPSKEVLFFLKKEGKPTYDIFLGQSTELSSVIQKELGKVKVAYLREAMAVETEVGEIYTFTIGERKGNELVRKLTPTWYGKGYGLAYNFNSSLSPSDFKGLSSTDELRASSCKCRLVTPNTTWDDCDSGGDGANSCSIGASGSDPGCSVSCVSTEYSTYYACCTN